MIELLTAIEAAAPVAQLRASRLAYPLVNAGHVLGLALLVGAVVPMDLRALGLVRGPDARALTAFLRPFAAAGLGLATLCGLLLFAVQATDYAASGWFRLKIGLLLIALVNAALHFRQGPPPVAAAALSLLLWPAILLCGRMIAYA